MMTHSTPNRLAQVLRIGRRAPATIQQVTAANRETRCVCGVRFAYHFLVMGGRRLDCAEIARRARGTK